MARTMTTERREAMIAALRPMWRDIFQTASEMAGPEHRAHLRYALQLLETGTPAWFDSVTDGDYVSAAIAQTFAVARCSESCYSHPNSLVRAILGHQGA